jgi:purine nucleoside phosphorylase
LPLRRTRLTLLSMSEIKVGLIGGTGLGELLRGRAQRSRHQVQTPFGSPSDEIIELEWNGLAVLFLSRHGPGHLLNPSQVPYRANIFALKKLGCTHIIASGAVGSLREEFKPRDLVIPEQIIDKTHRRAATFYDRAAVHVEFSEPFCPVLRQMLVEEGLALAKLGTKEEADAETGGRTDAVTRRRGDAEIRDVDNPTNSAGAALPASASFPASASVPPPASASVSPPVPQSFVTTHARGCYVCMEGPAFSTRAESLMHRLWGGDLIGMTCMPEAKLAREAEIAYALIALVTDYDCWRSAPAAKEPAQAVAADPAVLLKEIIANLQAASDNAAVLIDRTLRRIAANPGELAASPALEALRLAIWSDKSRILPDDVELLAPLWMKYFADGVVG